MGEKDGKIKAITVIGSNHMEMLDIEKFVITESDQVLMRVRAVGICRSNVHVIHGNDPYAVYSRVIGHKAAGETGVAGTAVEDTKAGDGVVFEPITYCRKCYAHRSGHHNVCRDLKVLRCIMNGTFREYAVVKRSQIYQHDKYKASYVQTVLCEPHTTGPQANWRGSVGPGDVVLAHGAGPIDLTVVDAAKSRGAVVIVSESNESRLTITAGFGADRTVNPTKEDLDALIMEVTKGEGVSMVFEAAGILALLEHAVKILSPAGRLVVMVFGQTPIVIDFKTVNAEELTILGTRHQMEKFPGMLEQFPNRLDRVDRPITYIFPAGKCEEAFVVLADKGSGVGRMVLIFD